MTAETDLLPLPEWTKRDDLGGLVPSEVRVEMFTYARACVSSATEALRAEVERLREIVRPKREEECLTLDHWRMRAYDLEANWSRCSRACAVEQGKREEAEARAERLAEALCPLVMAVEALKFDIFRLATPELQEAFDGCTVVSVVQQSTMQPLHSALVAARDALEQETTNG